MNLYLVNKKNVSGNSIYIVAESFAAVERSIQNIKDVTLVAECIQIVDPIEKPETK